MLQTLTSNWALLAVCGVLEAVISVVYLMMQGGEESIAGLSWQGAVRLVGQLSLAAGVCTIVVGLWNSAKGKCWPLVLNGGALIALGVIQYGLTAYRISILTIAGLAVLMALSLGALGLVVKRRLGPNHTIVSRWILPLIAVACCGFAVAFAALGLRWIRLSPGVHTDILWLGAYFGFSAGCLLGLAFSLRSWDRRYMSPALAAPRLAH